MGAPANSVHPVLLSKVGTDHRVAQKVPQKARRAVPEGVLQAPAELDVSAPTDKVAVRVAAGGGPIVAMPEAVRMAISKDVVKSLGPRTQKDAPHVPPGHRDDATVLVLQAASAPKFTSVEGDLNSTAAFDHDCILCRGSGLLCIDLLKDPCPLCNEGDTIVDERPMALSHSAVSDGSTHDAPPSESELVEDCSHNGSIEVINNLRQLGNEEDSQSGAEHFDCLADVITGMQVVPKPAAALTCTAPPGIGPPGVWVWPHVEKNAETDNAVKDAGEDREEDVNPCDWPEQTVNSVEMEFIGKVAQDCFGSDFIKMSVTWDEPWIQGQSIMRKASVQLHLEPMAPVYLDFLAPLARLQSLLHRDQAHYQCHISRMSLTKDFATMDLSCATVTAATCWDVLKNGYCPRPACTWSHPVPTLVNVSWTGGPEMLFGTKEEKIQDGPGSLFSMATVEMSNAQFNIGAYSSDDSSDD